MGRKRAVGKSSQTAVGKRHRESKLSNKHEKAKGKAQESRHQNRFPPLFYRAPPSRLNIIGLGAFLEPLGNQGLYIFDVFRQKASGFISARVAVQARVQGVYIYIYIIPYSMNRYSCI